MPASLARVGASRADQLYQAMSEPPRRGRRTVILLQAKGGERLYQKTDTH
jgi:hypothetical protein